MARQWPQILEDTRGKIGLIVRSDWQHAHSVVSTAGGRIAAKGGEEEGHERSGRPDLEADLTVRITRHVYKMKIH